MSAPSCQTCHATTDLREVTSRSLADGTERTQWFCADASACNDRRFPELADLLGAKGAVEAEKPQPEAEP